MSKAKHQPSGDTPEPAARKLRLDGEKTEQEDEMMLDKNYIMNKIEELQRQSSTAKVQAAFLLAQHADTQREKARKEIVFGGWSMFTIPTEDPEQHGRMMEYQTDSRERFIKETAKRAGISSNYYKYWVYNHQTKGDALSPITVVTVTQPWQRSKLLDYVKKGTGNLEERFYIEDEEESKWERIEKKFGQCQDDKSKTIRIQPQISLWDRITGLPLKVAMVVAQDYGLVFKHSWKDHTISHKDSNEYMMWANFSPENGTVTIYLSEKNIPSVNSFRNDYLKKFDELLNGTKGKGTGKGKTQPGPATIPDKELASLPLTHSSRSMSSKYPFMVETAIVDGNCRHTGKHGSSSGKKQWQQAPFLSPQQGLLTRASDVSPCLVARVDVFPANTPSTSVVHFVMTIARQSATHTMEMLRMWPKDGLWKALTVASATRPTGLSR